MKTQTNFMQIEPNSQFYTELDQILRSLQSGAYDREYMIIGLQNTIDRGFYMCNNIKKQLAHDKRKQRTKISNR